MSSWRTKRGESQIPASILHQFCCSSKRRLINLGLSRINHELSFPKYCKFVLQIPLFLSARWQQPLWGVHHYQQRCVPPSAHLVLHNFSSQGPIFRLCYSFISDIYAHVMHICSSEDQILCSLFPYFLLLLLLELYRLPPTVCFVFCACTQYTCAVVVVFLVVIVLL